MLGAQAEEMAAQKLRVAHVEAERNAQHGELLAARVGLIPATLEIETLRVRLARALRVAFGRSSEKLRDRFEQLELTLADIDELLSETEPAVNAGETATTSEPPDEPSKSTRRPCDTVGQGMNYLPALALVGLLAGAGLVRLARWRSRPTPAPIGRQSS